MAHGSRDHQIIHILFPQRLQKKGFPKTVGEMLLKNLFACQRLQGAADLSSLSAGAQERGSGVDGDMLDMGDGTTAFSEVIKEAQGFLRGLQNACELHLAAGEVVVLKVDEQQTGFHSTPPFASVLAFVHWNHGDDKDRHATICHLGQELSHCLLN
jgi:hypothetical protein